MHFHGFSSAQNKQSNKKEASKQIQLTQNQTEKGKGKRGISKPFFLKERRKSAGACKERTETEKGRESFLKKNTD